MTPLAFTASPKRRSASRYDMPVLFSGRVVAYSEVTTNGPTWSLLNYANAINADLAAGELTGAVLQFTSGVLRGTRVRIFDNAGDTARQMWVDYLPIQTIGSSPQVGDEFLVYDTPMAADIPMMDAAEVTGTVTTRGFYNRGSRGLTIRVGTTALAGTPEYQVSVEWQDPDSTDWREIWAASATISTATSTLYQIYPGSVSGGGEGFTEQASIVLPVGLIRVKITRSVGGAGAHMTVEAFVSLEP